LFFLLSIGKWSNISGALTCTEFCQAGQYGTGDGGFNETGACAHCPPGQWSATEGAGSVNGCNSW
tara:strand:+ start:546 stop:740 length:195 start_codon:yes stop_codon:yes gene_type:complete